MSVRNLPLPGQPKRLRAPRDAPSGVSFEEGAHGVPGRKANLNETVTAGSGEAEGIAMSSSCPLPGLAQGTTATGGLPSETEVISTMPPTDGDVATGAPGDIPTPEEAHTSGLIYRLEREGAGRSPPSCRTALRIGSQDLQAIIDTGATYTIMSPEAWAKVSHLCPPLKPTSVALRGASGAQLSVEGAADVTFRLQGKSYHFWFCIAELKGVDILLGLDFLMSVKAKVDLASMRVTIGEQEVRIGSEGVEPAHAVRLLERDVLPAGTANLFHAYVKDWPTGKVAIFEPVASYGTGITVTPSLHTPKEGEVHILIENRSHVSIDLNSMDILGCLQPLSSGSFSEVTDRTEYGSLPRVVRGHCGGAYPGWAFRNKSSPGLSGTGRYTANGERDPPLGLAFSGFREDQSTSARSQCLGIHVSGREVVRGTTDTGFPCELLGERPKWAPRPVEAELGGSAMTAQETTKDSRLDENLWGASTGGTTGDLPEYLATLLPDDNSLTPRQHARARELIHCYTDVFIGPDGKVGCKDRVKHTINTGDAEPTRCAYFRKSFREKDHIATEVSNMLSGDKIQPSCSPWASPVVLVKKKDGTFRFCVDYRKVNSVTKKDAYPLPRIEDCLDALNGCKWFSTLDLASGYWQVAMDDADMEKTAFQTHLGLYEFRVMPFGLCNAPATFERLMDGLLGDLKWTKCLVYLDDVVAFGTSFDIAMANLELVFERLRRANLKLKPKKCQLFRHRVEYLGHIISEAGVQPTPAKVEAILHWAAPTKLTEVRAFVGLTSYYRRFIPQYSEKARPLTRLTQKDTPFEWGPDQQGAFELLRNALVSQPVLAFPKPEGDFILDTDASLLAIGAVLSQVQDGDERVIAYASVTLSAQQQAYCTTKRELLAVVTFAEHFRSYVAGSKFLIRTDHASLRWLVNFRQSDNMLIRWITRLQQFDYEIVHRPGKDHGNADALSRMVRGNCGREECPECSANTSSRVPRGTAVNGAAFVAITRAQAKALTPTPAAAESPPMEPPNGSTENGAALRRSARIRHPRQPHCGCPDCGTTPAAEEPPGRTGGSTPLTGDCHGDDTLGGEDTGSSTSRPSSRDASPSPSRSEHSPADDVTTCRSPVVGRTPITVSRFPEITRDVGRLDRSPCSDTPAGRSGSDLPEDDVPLPSGEMPSPSAPEAEGEPPSISPRRGGDNGSSDAPEVVSVETRATWFPGATTANWRSWQDGDPVLKRVVSLLGSNPEGPPSDVTGEVPDVKRLCLQWNLLGMWEGVLCRRAPAPPRRQLDPEGVEFTTQRLVPLNLRRQLFRALHEQEAAHMGYDKVYPLLQARYFWLGMSIDVLDWLKACLSCQQIKPGAGKGRLPLHQEVAAAPMERIAMDIMGPWPRTPRGKEYVLVVQDYFSKWVEAWALVRHTAADVAGVLVRDYFSRYGAPERIHTDQGSEFTSKLMKSICQLWNIKKTRTAPYTPWSDGMVERCNRTILGMIAHYVGQSRDDWDEHLWSVVMAYNATPHRSTGFTPFFLFHSRCEDPRLPTDLAYGRSEIPRARVCAAEYAETQRGRMIHAFDLAARHLNRSATSQARCHDLGGLKVRKYLVGDRVWRFYPPAANQKLGKSWTGPWVVEAVQSDWQVKIARPTARDRPIWVNATCLKRVVEATR